MASEKPSGLRLPQPTRLPAFTASQPAHGGLHEMSDSQGNARSHYNAASVSNLKRVAPQTHGLQPSPKREKTRAATAGPRGYVKPVTLKDLGAAARTNHGASISSYGSTGLGGSRHAAYSSTATTSIGAGGRPPSRSAALARSRSNTTTTAARPARPVTSMGTRPDSKDHNVADMDERFGKYDSELAQIQEFMKSTAMDKDRHQEELDAARKRALQLQARKDELQDELDDTKRQLLSATRESQFLTDDLDKLRKTHQEECQALASKHIREREEDQRLLALEQDKLGDLLKQYEEKCGREAEAQREQRDRELADQRARVATLRHEKELEVQRLSLVIQENELLLKGKDEELRRATDRIEDSESIISRLGAKIAQLEENATSLEEAYGSSENRKDHQIGEMSRQLQELSRRADTAEREADEARRESKKQIENYMDEYERFKLGLKEKLVREEEKRHKLFEQVQDLKGNIRVMCRIRPPGHSETPVGFEYLESEYDEDKFAGVVVPTEKDHFQEEGKKVAGKSPPFQFERTFDPACTNADVFDEIGQLVQSVMDGKKVCVFCYGQTGSGKTYTMSHQERDQSHAGADNGIVPRAKELIFNEVERLTALGWEYSVEGSYLEVYKNKLYDLLAPRDSTLRPLDINKVSDELEINGHEFTALDSADDLDAMVRMAETNRHVAETNMNRASSRSHSILILRIRGRKSLGDGKFKTREGMLNLIDLAGSESIGRSGATGETAEEGRQINMSLTHLGTVLKQLGEGRKKEAVDFRSYTLTQVLKPSLGEKCRTLMFVMVSASKDNVKETISSLKFAENAQKVKQNGGGKGVVAKRSK